jgi:hypothetical protein
LLEFCEKQRRNLQRLFGITYKNFEKIVKKTFFILKNNFLMQNCKKATYYLHKTYKKTKNGAKLVKLLKIFHKTRKACLGNSGCKRQLQYSSSFNSLSPELYHIMS